ncbi:hypothetical protein Tco_0077659 [Tanacetum coccineum]
MAALQYKDDHNRIAYLGREKGSEDFEDILSYVDHSPLRYALTHDPPVVFDSLVKQFWATAAVRPNAAGSHDLVATIDGREVVVTESLIRTQLHFEDANGIVAMPNSDILEGMRVIGYPTDRALTFLKHHLSPQWRFLVHTLLHCLSPKSGSWNQFPSSIATALIYLSTGREYNFSRFILEGMIANGEQMPLTPPCLPLLLLAMLLMRKCAAHEVAGSSARQILSLTLLGSPVRELNTGEGQHETVFGRIDSCNRAGNLKENQLAGAILTLVSRVKEVGRTVTKLKTTRFVGDAPATEGDVIFQDDVGPCQDYHVLASEAPGDTSTCSYLLRTEFHTSAFAQFHAPLSTDVLPQADISESAGPSVGADKGKAPMPDLEIPAEFLAEDRTAGQCLEEGQVYELNECVYRNVLLILMMQVGSNPALARELLGADVTEDNFIERMTAIKERKKRALADLPHNGTITMTAIKAMTKQQLIEEYEYICRRLENDRLLSAQYNLFRPKPAITEPPSKRQMVERGSSQSASVPAATAHTADDPDSTGGGSSHPAGSVTLMAGSAASNTAGGTFDATGIDSTVPTTAAMDSAGSRRESISGDEVVFVDKLPDDEIVDPRVKVETVSASAFSPPRSRRKHFGMRSDDFLWDKPVEDFQF